MLKLLTAHIGQYMAHLCTNFQDSAPEFSKVSYVRVLRSQHTDSANLRVTLVS